MEVEVASTGPEVIAELKTLPIKVSPGTGSVLINWPIDMFILPVKNSHLVLLRIKRAQSLSSLGDGLSGKKGTIARNPISKPPQKKIHYSPFLSENNSGVLIGPKIASMVSWPCLYAKRCAVDFFPKYVTTTAHLFAYKHGQETMDAIFGPISTPELFSLKNGLKSLKIGHQIYSDLRYTPQLNPTESRSVVRGLFFRHLCLQCQDREMMS